MADNIDIETEAAISLVDELGAMKAMADTLDNMNTLVRTRVLKWVWDRYSPDLAIANPARNHSETIEAAPYTSNAVADLPSLFDIANPSSGTEKALVVGYWQQEIQGEADFGSQAINTELKHLGHAVANITSAFSDLIKGKYVLQIKKSGKSQQARKRYRLTMLGIKRVQEMLGQR